MGTSIIELQRQSIGSSLFLLRFAYYLAVLQKSIEQAAGREVRMSMTSKAGSLMSFSAVESSSSG